MLWRVCHIDFIILIGRSPLVKGKSLEIERSGSPILFRPTIREAADLIRSGRLGKIQTVTVGVGGPSKWCDLPAAETGARPGLGPLARPCALAALQFDPQPARGPRLLPQVTQLS